MTFLNLLTILFIGLKLTNYVTWSWVWVLAPLWAPFALALTLILLLSAFIGTDETLKELKKIKSTLKKT